MSYISAYLEGVKDLLNTVRESDVEGLVRALEGAWREDRRVLIMGNGGSSARQVTS